MNENKLKIWLKSLGIKIKDNIGPILFWTGTGIAVGGGWTALKDHRRVQKLEKSMSGFVDVHNKNVEAYDDSIDELRGKIEDLERQNNLLMEKALKETEGKAS